MNFDNLNENEPNEKLDGVDDEASSPSTMTMSNIMRPEGLGEEDGLDLDAIDGKGRGMNKGTLIAMAVIVVGVGTLWLMRAGQNELIGQASAEVEAKIEQALARLTNPDALATDDPLRKENLKALFGDTEQVLAMFSTDPTKQQVPIEFVKKNPFTLPATKKIAPPVVKVDDSAVAKQKELERQLKSFKLAAKGLQLQSVLGGKHPAAVINGDVIRVGQAVGEFKLVKVNRLSVIVRGGQWNFELKMNQNNR